MKTNYRRYLLICCVLGSTLKRFISLKEEFPEAWFQLESGAADTTIPLMKKHFPFFVQSKALNITGATAFGAKTEEITGPNPSTVDWNCPISAIHINPAGDDVWLLVEYNLS